MSMFQSKKDTFFEQSEAARKAMLNQVLFNSDRLLKGFQQGMHTSFFRSSGLEYAESTLYTYGDDARYIDWKVFSRLSSVYTKLFHEDTNRLVWVIFDCSSSTQIGAPHSLFEVGMESVLTLLHIALRQKNKVGGILFSDDILHHIRPSRIYNTLSKFTNTLFQYQYGGGSSNLEKSIQYTRDILKRRGLVIICSDFLIDDSFTQIQKLSKQYDVLLVKPYYEAKNILARRDTLNIIDSEVRYNKMLSLSQLRNTLSDTQAKEQQKWEMFCAQNRIPFVSISTTDSVLSRLQALLAPSRRSA